MMKRMYGATQSICRLQRAPRPLGPSKILEIPPVSALAFRPSGEPGRPVGSPFVTFGHIGSDEQMFGAK
jgi:hypothetical protein